MDLLSVDLKGDPSITLAKVKFSQDQPSQQHPLYSGIHFNRVNVKLFCTHDKIAKPSLLIKSRLIWFNKIHVFPTCRYSI